MTADPRKRLMQILSIPMLAAGAAALGLRVAADAYRDFAIDYRLAFWLSLWSNLAFLVLLLGGGVVALLRLYGVLPEFTEKERKVFEGAWLGPWAVAFWTVVAMVLLVLFNLFGDPDSALGRFVLDVGPLLFAAVFLLFAVVRRRVTGDAPGG